MVVIISLRCFFFQVFVLQRQVLLLSFGGTLPDLPDIPDLHPPVESSVISSPRTSVLDVLVPKPGSEITLGMPFQLSFVSVFAYNWFMFINLFDTSFAVRNLFIVHFCSQCSAM